jgi:hypothetical protein
MTIHYHGTPITPMTALYELSGRHFCVSFARPDDVYRCHAIGQSVMLDNGAFSKWKRNAPTNWPAYYKWTDEWLACPTTWAVIPDVIDGSEQDQDQLIGQWPHGQKGAPVWHMNESIARLLQLIENWPRVCIGSTAVYAKVLSNAWCDRMDAAWDAIVKHSGRLPWVHMLRGMACCGRRWPFASVDSTDVARNHKRSHNSPLKLANRWDQVQCPMIWLEQGKQMSTHLQEVGASEAQKMGPTDQDLIEKYLEIKAYVEQEAKEQMERLKPAMEGMELIKNVLLGRLNERGADNTKTESGTAYKSRILDVKVIGRQEFLEFALHQNPDMLQVGAVKDSVKEYIAEHERTPPGLETSTTIRINIRRS